MLTYTSNELYLDKACKVNLNYSAEVCDDMNSNNVTQVEVQKFVSGVQAFNGILQSVPAILFTFVLGSLSDRIGRGPLILIGLLSGIVLNLVFLINSFWFYELRTEFLLFECLQDVLGGGSTFFIGCYALLADKTETGERTRRMARIQAMSVLGWASGLLLGAPAKAVFGWTGLYLFCLAILVATTLF